MSLVPDHERHVSHFQFPQTPAAPSPSPASHRRSVSTYQGTSTNPHQPSIDSSTSLTHISRMIPCDDSMKAEFKTLLTDHFYRDLNRLQNKLQSLENNLVVTHSKMHLKQTIPEVASTTSSSLSPEQKMQKNAIKAIEEHLIMHKDHTDVYASKEALSIDSPDEASTSIPQPLKFNFSCEQAANPAIKTKTELNTLTLDTCFCQEITQGLIAGIFDGHEGKAVAEYAKNQFPEKFAAGLKNENCNIKHLFEDVIQTIHEEVSAHSEWNHMGCTAVMCFIDKDKKLIYTATLGNAEANIYRMIDGQLKSIPLSCIRNWSSQKDAKRAADYWRKIAISEIQKRSDASAKKSFTYARIIETSWPNAKLPNLLRFPYLRVGLNASRTIGDNEINHVFTGLSRKPKVTVTAVFPGDKCILTSDGLKATMPEEEIMREIQRAARFKVDAALTLVDQAYLRHAQDDITVISIDLR